MLRLKRKVELTTDFTPHHSNNSLSQNMETFYGKFLKSENLDFRMDFDQAFKKLSPFMAFKTFAWILDWMTNDR